MAKIAMFMLCSSVNNTQEAHGPVTQLIDPQVALRPGFIPSTFSFGMAVGVQGINLHQPNRLKFTISAPDGKVVQKSEETVINAFAQNDTLPAEYQGLMLNLDIRNMVIKNEGVYTFTLYVNDEPMEDQRIPIYRGGRSE